MSDWSYWYGKPRSVVHQERYGTNVTPARRYARGVGRRATLEGEGSWIWIAGALLFIYLITRKK